MAPSEITNKAVYRLEKCVFMVIELHHFQL